MKKRLALMGVLVVLGTVVWLAPTALACWNCLAGNCEDFPWGHNSCSAWTNPDGGRGCVAGGGLCMPEY